MMKKANLRTVQKIIQWSLFTVVVVYMITGFGISYFRTVETITFGWLTKNLSFRIHDVLWIPFLVLLVLHIALPYFFRKKSGNRD